MRYDRGKTPADSWHCRSRTSATVRASRGRTGSQATRSRRPRTPVRFCREFAARSCAASGFDPVHALARVEHYGGEHHDDDKEHERDRRAVADVVVNKRDAVEIDIDRLGGRARAALRDREDDVET